MRKSLIALIAASSVGMAAVTMPTAAEARYWGRGWGWGLGGFVLGAAVALNWNAPVAAAMALVGFFALFHGHAHGAEMPTDASGLAYASGFMLATAILHAIGVGLGLSIGASARNYSQRLAQVGGGAMALAGVGLLTGWL